MRVCRWLLLFCLLLPCTAAAHASETPAEHAANVYAADEMASHPVHGNLPDYSLPSDKLAKGQHLETIGNVLAVGEPLFGIAEVLLLLSLGIAAWMRAQAEVVGTRRPLQYLMAVWMFFVFMALVDVLPAALIAYLHLRKPLAPVLQIASLAGSAVIVWMRRGLIRGWSFRWLQGYTFLFLLLVISFLFDLPLTIYRHHLGLQYGLSVQGWGSYFWDEAKSSLLSWVFGGLLLMLLFWVIRRFPRRWWLIFWGLSIPITLFGIFAGPYINFLFNKYEPLARSNPALVAQIEQVVEKGHMNIPPERMFLMKASEKVTTLNADVEGFGASKRVVVWDTTISKMTPDEVLGVFGHESGHYVLGHITRGVYLSIAITFFVFLFGYGFLQWALRRFGVRWRIPAQGDWAALVVLMLAVSLFGIVLTPLTNTLSRQQEHAADVYGQEAIHGLVANPQLTMQGAFDVLGTNSFDVPNPPYFEEFWLGNHPAIGRRAAFAHAYDPWAAGSAPKYFPKS